MSLEERKEEIGLYFTKSACKTTLSTARTATDMSREDKVSMSMVVQSGEVGSASGYKSRGAVAAFSSLPSSPQLNHHLIALRTLYGFSAWQYRKLFESSILLELSS